MGFRVVVSGIKTHIWKTLDHTDKGSVSHIAGIHLETDCTSIRSCWDSVQCILSNLWQKREVGRVSSLKHPFYFNHCIFQNVDNFTHSPSFGPSVADRNRGVSVWPPYITQAHMSQKLIMHEQWVINLTLTRRWVLTQIIPHMKPKHCDSVTSCRFRAEMNEWSFVKHPCHLL